MLTLLRGILAGTLLGGSCIALFIALQSIALFPWLMLTSLVASLCCLLGACVVIDNTPEK